jgi:coatomer protein complex subunit alpha (xenin)
MYDYNQSRRIACFEGHADYIRTVTFHHTHPLILSACDDQTMRLWNFQSKKHLLLLSGHRHYVMCAKFHQEKNLIVSGSLDQTIRLWNFDRLVEKISVSGGVVNQVDVELLTVIDAHDKGVNWVSFHPINDLIMSAADDRRVKIWKYTESGMTEKETFFGHQFNVCCVEASPKTGQIVSNSEDCTLRVWDDNGVCIDTYTKNGEKQWMIDCHQNLPLVAIGTDKSLVILGLDTLKFYSASQGMNAFFVKDFDFCMKDLDSSAEKVLIESLNRGSAAVKRSGKPSLVQANGFNKSKWGFIVTYNETKSTDAKVYYVEVDKKNYSAQSKQILAQNAVFIGKNKIAYLNNGNIELTDTETLLSIGSVKGLTKIDQIYEGGVGKIVYRTRTQVKLYDTVGKKTVGSIDELVLKKLKRTVWNKNNSVCALVCKKMIFLMNKNFQRIARFNEGYKIQGAIWTSDNVLVYTTYNHIKYILTNGDQGILKSLDSIRYPVQMKDDILYCFDTEGTLIQEKVDREDYLFKRSIQSTNIKKVKAYIKENNTPGNSMISYLCKKNYPSVALSLAQDEKAKFQLAIRSGNLQAAYEAANNIKKKECYSKLASEALK